MKRILTTLAALTIAAQTHAQAPEAVRSFGAQDAVYRLTVRGTTDILLFGPVLRAFTAANPQYAVDYEQWLSLIHI